MQIVKVGAGSLLGWLGAFANPSCICFILPRKNADHCYNTGTGPIEVHVSTWSPSHTWCLPSCSMTPSNLWFIGGNQVARGRRLLYLLVWFRELGHLDDCLLLVKKNKGGTDPESGRCPGKSFFLHMASCHVGTKDLWCGLYYFYHLCRPVKLKLKNLAI